MLTQTDGGYLGSDFETCFSAVVSGAAGVYVGILVEDAGITTALVIRPGQIVSVSGDRPLVQAPLWGSGEFTVQERGSLSLTYVTVESDLTLLGGGGLTLQSSMVSGALSVTDGVLTVRSSSLSGDLIVSGVSTASLSGCTLATSVSLTTTGGGSLSLVSTPVPRDMLGEAERQLSGANSTLRLSAVSVPEAPATGELLTGTMTVEADGSKTVDPPGFGVAPAFTVSSGPCTVSDDGRCVGRPGGYLPSEACTIVVIGGGGVLGPCGVFDMHWDDGVGLPGSAGGAAKCKSGVALAPGESVAWHSGDSWQGDYFPGVVCPCSTQCYALCGLPHSDLGLGGG